MPLHQNTTISSFLETIYKMPSEAQFLIFLVKIRRVPRKTLRHYKLGCWRFVHLLNVDTLSYAIFYFILGARSYEV